MAPAEPQEAAASPIAPARSGGWGKVLGLLRRFGWLIVVAAFVIGGAIFAAQRDDSGEITQGGTLAITDLRVGDCFDHRDIDAEEVDARRCDESHQFEMMFMGTMRDGEYPIEGEFESYVETVCLPAFGDYVGLDYQSSRLDVYWYFPLEEGWNQGDHVMQCAIYDPLDSQLVGSLRGAAY
jgi:hypothetical protein